MRKLLVQLGKDFASNKWAIAFANNSSTFSFSCEDGYAPTIPYPGVSLEKKDIENMIQFLQKTLEEYEEDEQGILE